MAQCKVCGKEVTKFVKSKNDWSEWCSNKCMSISPDILRKKEMTNTARYGGHPMRNKEVQDKHNQTVLAKYGHTNPFSSKEIQDKIKQHHIEKYGVDNPSKSKAVIEKIKEKAITRYHDCKDEIMSKRRKTSMTRFGVDSNKRAHISPTSLQLMKDIEWLSEQHLVLKKSCTLIAKELGISPTPILDLLKDNNISRIRHSVSTVETEIREFLQTLTQELVFNDRSILAPNEIDIYIPSKRLAIEVNGVYWHSEEKGKDSQYHLKKTMQCEQKDIQLIHIYDTEWHNPITQKIIKSKLRHLFNLSTRISARKCSVALVSTNEAKAFATANHIQGYCNARYKIGLYFNNDLVALATFGKPRFNKNFNFELLRFCSKLDHTVVGGMGKIMAYATKTLALSRIISYADRRWTKNIGNNVYLKSGFQLLSIASPNYKYFQITGSDLTLRSRNQFQKHKLKDILPNFDASMSEYENVSMNGYYRIWDSGNLVFNFKENNE